MALGKQITHYRLKAGWKFKDLSDKSDVDVGTLNALEKRDSVKSEFFQQIAQAFGLTLEQLADETKDYDLSHLKNSKSKLVYANDRDAHPTVHQLATEHSPLQANIRAQDKWTIEALEILSRLDDGQKQAMVSKMREFLQYLGPPRDGQTLSMAV